MINQGAKATRDGGPQARGHPLLLTTSMPWPDG